ncbi:hypothetical protein GCM10010440_70850 [Kitasatospora cinereorecta]
MPEHPQHTLPRHPERKPFRQLLGRETERAAEDGEPLHAGGEEHHPGRAEQVLIGGRRHCKGPV